ncbi:MAG: hypothetical protein ACOZCL_15055 [Bacillota bacterium]
MVFDRSIQAVASHNVQAEIRQLMFETGRLADLDAGYLLVLDTVLIGADIRDASIKGANLRNSIFLHRHRSTQPLEILIQSFLDHWFARCIGINSIKAGCPAISYTKNEYWNPIHTKPYY